MRQSANGNYCHVDDVEVEALPQIQSLWAETCSLIGACKLSGALMLPHPLLRLNSALYSSELTLTFFAIPTVGLTLR